jgi:hypothetical protein
MSSKLSARRRPLRYPALAAAMFGLLLAVITSQWIAQGADFQNYADYFNLARDEAWRDTLETRFEPLFALLVLLLAKLFSVDTLVFATLVALSLFIKARALADLTPSRDVLMVLLAYYCVRFLPLHELTQIRIAIALGLFLLALRARHGTAAFILMLAAVLMHYSTVLMVPVLLAWRMVTHSPQRFERWQHSLVLGGVVGIVVLSQLLEPLLQSLSLALAILDLYASQGFGEDAVNPFSLALVLDVTLLALGWLLRGRDLQARFWLSVLTLSVVAFYALIDFPVLAHRVREMMSVCWLMYLAAALRLRGLPRLHGWLCIVVTTPAYLYLNFVGANALFTFNWP